MAKAGFVEPRVSDYGNAATRLTRVLRPNFNYRNFVLAGGGKSEGQRPEQLRGQTVVEVSLPFSRR